MRKGDHRPDAPGEQVVHHGGIDGHGLVVPCALFRFQTTPGHGKAIGVESKIAEQLEIVLPAAPVVARLPAGLKALRRFVDRPVVDEVSLNLMRRRGRARSREPLRRNAARERLRRLRALRA